MPISEEPLEGLKEGDLTLPLTLFSEHSDQLFSAIGRFSQRLLQVSTDRPTPQVPPGSQDKGMAGILGRWRPELIEKAPDDFFLEANPFPYPRDGCLPPALQCLEAEEMALDCLRNPDVDVSPEDTAGDDEDHAPERDGHKAAEPKRGMKKDEVGTECAKEDVCLEPMLQFSVSA